MLIQYEWIRFGIQIYVQCVAVCRVIQAVRLTSSQTAGRGDGPGRLTAVCGSTVCGSTVCSDRGDDGEDDGGGGGGGDGVATTHTSVWSAVASDEK